MWNIKVIVSIFCLISLNLHATLDEMLASEGLDGVPAINRIIRMLQTNTLDKTDFEAAFNRAQKAISITATKYDAAFLLNELNKKGLFQKETLDIANKIDMDSAVTSDTTIKLNLLRGLVESGFGIEEAKKVALGELQKKTCPSLRNSILLYIKLVEKKECYMQALDAINLANDLIKHHKCTGVLALILPNYKLDLLSALVDQNQQFDFAYQDAFVKHPFEAASFANKAAYIRLFTAFAKQGQHLPQIKDIFKQTVKSLNAVVWEDANLSMDANNILIELATLLGELLKIDAAKDVYELLETNFLSDQVQDIKNVSIIYLNFLVKYLGLSNDQAREIIKDSHKRSRDEKEKFIKHLSTQIAAWLLKFKLTQLKTSLMQLKYKLSILNNKLDTLNQKLIPKV